MPEDSTCRGVLLARPDRHRLRPADAPRGGCIVVVDSRPGPRRGSACGGNALPAASRGADRDHVWTVQGRAHRRGDPGRRRPRTPRLGTRNAGRQDRNPDAGGSWQVVPTHAFSMTGRALAPASSTRSAGSEPLFGLREWITALTSGRNRAWTTSVRTSPEDASGANLVLHRCRVANR